MKKIRTKLYIHKWTDNRCVLSTIQDWYSDPNAYHFEYHYFRKISCEYCNSAGIFNCGPMWFDSPEEAFEAGTTTGFNVHGIPVEEGV